MSIATWTARRGRARPSFGRASLRALPTAPAGLRRAAPWMVVVAAATILGVGTAAASLLPARLVPLALLAIVCPFLAMMVRDPRRLLLALIVLDIPLQMDVHLFYRFEPAKLGALGGLNISLTTVALVGLYVLWLAQYLARVGRPP